MAEATLRQRKAQSEEPDQQRPRSPPKIKITKADADDDDEYSPWVDILRVLTFLFVASCGLSYVISGGDSWFWGLKDKPDYMKVDWWKEKWVCFILTCSARLTRLTDASPRRDLRPPSI